MFKKYKINEHAEIVVTTRYKIYSFFKKYLFEDIFLFSCKSYKRHVKNNLSDLKDLILKKGAYANTTCIFDISIGILLIYYLFKTVILNRLLSIALTFMFFIFIYYPILEITSLAYRYPTNKIIKITRYGPATCLDLVSLYQKRYLLKRPVVKNNIEHLYKKYISDFNKNKSNYILNLIRSVVITLVFILIAGVYCTPVLDLLNLHINSVYYISLFIYNFSYYLVFRIIFTVFV